MIFKLIIETDKIPDNFTGMAECPDGNTIHFLNGKHHRLDGPASIYSDGRECYCINGKYLSKEDWQKKVQELQNPTPSLTTCSGKIIEIDGKKYKLTEI